MIFSKEIQNIIEGCCNHQSLAQRKLYELFAPKMMALCYRYARNRDEAEDMLQEGFLKVFQNIEKYKMEGSLEGWIRRIIVNCAIDSIRKQKTWQLETQINEQITEGTIGDEGIDTMDTEYLLNTIQKLPVGYRLVFNLFAIEGYSHAEIAEKLSITESTSRSQFTRAKTLLRKRIHEDCMEYKDYQDAV